MDVRCVMLGLATMAVLLRASAAHASPGAVVPWTTYEAEAGRTNGQVLGPDFDGQTPAREASERRCVRLAETGQFVEIIAKGEASGIVIRYSLPDSADGRGIDATLGLYINGTLTKKLALTSRLSHLYGPYPFTNDPKAGTPRNFWDEVRVMPGDIHAGDIVRLQKDADDVAAEYLIDLINLEPVPAPIEKLADAIAATEFGAVADDDQDDRPAIVAAIDAAKTQRKSVWIPAGNFVVKGAIDVSDVTIRGAGMWHTTLVGVDDYKPENRVAFYGRGSNVTLADFAILGKLNYRNDAEPNDGIGESLGTGSQLQNLWIEHTKAGAWLANADGLVVEGCRFRNTIADGINLCVGMRNTIVRNCTTRGTGDDCFAMWPATYAKAIYPHGGNKFVNCTAQLPFLAQAFSIYGGDSNSVENCAAIDIPYGAGLYASTTFPSDSGFHGTTVFMNNSLLRAGGGDGAIGTVANLIDLVGLRFQNIDVIDSPTDGIKFVSMKGHQLRNATFDRIRVVGPAGHGIVEAQGSAGSATLTNVSVTNAKSAGWRDESKAFELVQGEGNSGITSETREDRTSAK